MKQNPIGSFGELPTTITALDEFDQKRRLFYDTMKVLAADPCNNENYNFSVREMLGGMSDSFARLGTAVCSIANQSASRQQEVAMLWFMDDNERITLFSELTAEKQAENYFQTIRYGAVEELISDIYSTSPNDDVVGENVRLNYQAHLISDVQLFISTVCEVAKDE